MQWFIIPAATAAAALLIAGPAAAIDYVQCNAMRVAYDRELAALIAERMRRRDAGLAASVQRCGLPPIAGSPGPQVAAYEACRLPAYDEAVQQWDQKNGQLDPKTGKTPGSRYALNVAQIYINMEKQQCPLP